ncbi:MAG TPA: 3-mercaptopyruvate sulfurtransferase [Alphaproteobacteria bacterium]|nr:3-mercaptopyruvate sulfurtransferase [Alphaproteobacteria bacterium]
MKYANPDALISTDALAARLAEPDLVILDATFHLPTAKRDARAEYAREHIPGARFFDIDIIADRATDLPHMLPSPGDFARAAGALGIDDDCDVVVYDTHGISSAPRTWWMLRIFGHRRTRVLDGGLPKWKREGRPVNDLASPAQPRPFTPRFDAAMVRDKANVRANIGSRREQVLDARSAGRFRGVDPEPRPGLRSGHIPGSCSLPYNLLVDPKTQTMLPADGLRARFVEAGIDLTRPVITSCGSGVTACALALGLHLLGHDRVAVYDGSWAEWGLPGDTPVETG